jgi:uridine kinase
VEAPLGDYPSNTFVTQTFDFSTVGALIVEGTYVLQLDDLDARIFLEATHEDTWLRRDARARNIHEPFVDDVLRIEHRFIAPQAARADILLDRDFVVTRRTARGR